MVAWIARHVWLFLIQIRQYGQFQFTVQSLSFIVNILSLWFTAEDFVNDADFIEFFARPDTPEDVCTSPHIVASGQERT